MFVVTHVLVSKASGLKLDKKLGNFLSNQTPRISSLNILYISGETCIAMQCNDFCLSYLKIAVTKKNGFYIPLSSLIQ